MQKDRTMVTNIDKERMVDKILMFWFVCNAPNKPGAFIKKWCMHNEKDKEILKSLTAKDFNHRIDEYPI